MRSFNSRGQISSINNCNGSRNRNSYQGHFEMVKFEVKYFFLIFPWEISILGERVQV